MSSELEQAHRSLDALPASAQKTQAINFLAEIEEGRTRTAEALNNLELALNKLAPSPREQRIFRLLPWGVELLALAALYTGVDAIWNAEYCSHGRSGFSCSHGLRAQLEGGATVAIAVLLAIVPIPACKAKVAALWLLGLTGAALLLASLLLHNVV